MKGEEPSIQRYWEFDKVPAKVLQVLVLAILLAAAVSCSTGEFQDQDASIDGENLFKKSVLGGKAGCATCHSLEEGVILLGPSLAGIGTTSSQRIPGMSAEDYIQESILKPDAYVLDGFPAGVMPDSYVDNLSEAEINSIVEFLLTVKE
jgi:mono/diheme cytochrome c family protein